MRGSGPYPVGPEHVGLVVEVVSASGRKTDRVAIDLSSLLQGSG